jgi:SNF2 family DNA or RNA helicase
VIVFPGKVVLVEPGAQTTDAHLTDTKLIEYKGKEYLAMPHTVDTCHQLARIGMECMSPIRTEYDWPGRFDPYTHQLRTAEFLSNHWRAFCLNEIGTGKTIAALWAADYLMKQGKIKKAFIISTLSTLQRVWADEIFQNMPTRKFAIVHGTKEQRLEALAQDVDFYIINHDGLKVLCDWETQHDKKFIKSCALDGRDDIDLFILDEGAQFRNQGTDRYDALKKCLGERGIWWMTGSPMPNAPTDIWAQARIVCPSRVEKFFSRFRDKVMYQAGPYKWKPKQDWEKTVYEKVKPCILFKRDDCLDLPPCTTVTRRCEMSKQQSKAYEELKKTFTLELAEGTINAVNEGVKRMKLVQVACGSIYDGEGGTHIIPAKPKFDLLEQTLEESGRKLLVYVPFKHTLKMLEEFMTKKGYTVGVVNGDVPAGKRADIFHEFQSGDLEVIAAHPAAMAHGLTLTASHTIFWWAPVDDNEIYQQANGRISRPSQTNKQTIVHGSCSDVEDRIYKALEFKESMQGLLKDLLTTDM